MIKTNRELHEDAAGMGLCDAFFTVSGINPDSTPELDRLTAELTAARAELHTLQFQSQRNDTDMPDAELVAALHDELLDITDDADNGICGTILSKVQAMKSVFPELDRARAELQAIKQERDDNQRRLTLSKDFHEAFHRLLSLAGISWDEGDDVTGAMAAYNIDDVRETMGGLYDQRRALQSELQEARRERDEAHRAEGDAQKMVMSLLREAETLKRSDSIMLEEITRLTPIFEGENLLALVRRILEGRDKAILLHDKRKNERDEARQMFDKANQQLAALREELAKSETINNNYRDLAYELVPACDGMQGAFMRFRILGSEHAQLAKALEIAERAHSTQLRTAWEMGFALARNYGDNHFHFSGEQKERQWNKALAAIRCGKQEGES